MYIPQLQCTVNISVICSNIVLLNANIKSLLCFLAVFQFSSRVSVFHKMFSSRVSVFHKMFSSRVSVFHKMFSSRVSVFHKMFSSRVSVFHKMLYSYYFLQLLMLA